MQVISFTTVKLNMADEVSLWTPDKVVAKMYISKRNIRKCQEKHLITHFLPDNHPISNTHNLKGDSSFGNYDTPSLFATNSSGMFFLNPQTPNWTLAEKCADLSLGGEGGVCGDECTANEAQLDTARQEGSSCAKAMRSREVQSDDSANCRISKLEVPSADSQGCSPDGGVNMSMEKNEQNPPIKDVILFDACKDGKLSRLFAAMKKRSSGLDTEHRPYKCTHCHWSFKKFCNLQSHLDTHSGLKPHVCNICGKAYSHQGTLQQHKRLHTGERPYHCPFCAKTYIWSSDYRKHIRTHTGEKPYVCGTCGKDFVRSSDLRKHERNMHTNDKPFPCTHCGKTFNKPLSLQRHERKHLGERPFSCPDCGKAFALASRMAEHQKIHRGVRPYVCSVCSKSFTKSSNLLEHEAIHSGVRPHKCTECGVAFAMASRLVRHQYIHSGETPFSCPGCSMNFSSLHTLKHHQEKSCAGRIFVCVQCDKSFQCASKLTQHMLSHTDKNV